MATTVYGDVCPEQEKQEWKVGDMYVVFNDQDLEDVIEVDQELADYLNGKVK